MELRYSALSPFVRKVMVFAYETGLNGRIEPVPTDVWADDSDIQRDNPLGKVPTLVTPDGTFAGSTLCCEYLDTLHGGARLCPAPGRESWPALQLHALADGVMEAAVAHVVERLRRPAPSVYQGNLDRQRDKIVRTLDAIERASDMPGDAVHIGTITLACALGYVDFRLPELRWREGRPRLAGWYRGMAERPSMQATAPTS